jgi:protoporphyrin/coproporphyrin ferrochelatase
MKSDANSQAPVGVLLVNLGTPDAPRTPEVRRYLREFLSDGRVIDVPAPLRWLLVNGVIAPFRARRSAAAYSKVWTERGSPLLFHTRDLGERLEAELGGAIPVAIGMRYGGPSIGAGMEELRARGVEQVVVAPLYPQYASSSTGTALEAAYRAAAERWNTPFLATLPPFYDAPPFVRAWVEVARPHLERFRPDGVLFSFHGLPERHLAKSDDAAGVRCRAAADCCAAVVAQNRHCYRAQCFATARALAAGLGLGDGEYEVAFQSRLGRGWIEPFTDERLPVLARGGTRRLAVLCPAFVADCLETLEEIGMAARESFREAGGEDLLLVPSLNAEAVWVEALAELLTPLLPDASRKSPHGSTE